MREIKFRVWTGLSMEYNVVVGKDGAFYALIDKNDTACLSPTSKYHADTPVMQYTGLDDKNNDPIYEGDIIKLEGSPYIYEVVWNKWQWGIDSKGVVADFIQGFTSAIKDRAIIIGNMMENPELITQRESVSDKNQIIPSSSEENYEHLLREKADLYRFYAKCDKCQKYAYDGVKCHYCKPFHESTIIL